MVYRILDDNHNVAEVAPENGMLTCRVGDARQLGAALLRLGQAILFHSGNSFNHGAAKQLKEVNRSDRASIHLVVQYPPP